MDGYRGDKFDKQQAQIRYNAMKAEIEEMGKSKEVIPYK